MFDYLSRFIWGLGANATTKGVVQLMSIWGVQTAHADEV